LRARFLLHPSFFLNLFFCLLAALPRVVWGLLRCMALARLKKASAKAYLHAAENKGNDWVVEYDVDNSKYYRNTVTNETSWDNPFVKTEITGSTLKKKAKMQFNSGLYEEAIETYEKILNDPKLLYRVETRAGGKSVGVGDAGADKKIGVDDGNFYRTKGQCHFYIYKKDDSSKNVQKALECYQKAIDELNFVDPEVLCEAAEVYRRHNAHEGALVLYGTVIEHFPRFKGITTAAMNAVCCMFRTGTLDQATDYLFWLADAPPPGVPEDVLYLLAARVYELIGREDLAAMGFEDLFQRKKAQGLTQMHDNWATWRDDAELWRQCSELFLELEMYELLDHCNAQTFRCSPFHTGSFFAHWAHTNSLMGDTATAEKHLRSIFKGEFIKDACDSKRTITSQADRDSERGGKYGKPLTGEHLEILNIVEKSEFMRRYIQKRVTLADLNARQIMEQELMAQAEVETKWFLTELKIWTNGIKICAYARGHLARNYRRKAYKAILDIERVFRGHMGRKRASRLMALRRINAVRFLARQYDRMRVLSARWKLMAVGARRVATGRWAEKAALWRFKKFTFSHTVFLQRMVKAIETEKLNRAAILIQRLFRNRMMKELIKMIASREPSEMIMRLFYRDALTGPCREVLGRLLDPYATEIQCRYRQKKAVRRVARRRAEHKRWLVKQEEARKRAARRKATLDFQRRQREEAKRREDRKKRMKEIQTRKDVMKGLVQCFADPKWDEINRLLVIGTPLLGEDHNLIVRGKKVAKVLEKEWLHFNRSKERRRVMGRARDRKYESVEEELDREFVKGNIHIIPSSPPTSPVNLPKVPQGYADSSSSSSPGTPRGV
jgi:tetratricopeptide (TPR) repeat protein